VIVAAKLTLRMAPNNLSAQLGCECSPETCTKVFDAECCNWKVESVDGTENPDGVSVIPFSS
jgi:hypothetical protein